MAYTIRLTALECLMSEEIDGDETYLKLNETKIWEAHPDKMSHLLDHDGIVSHFDFAVGRKLTSAGWITIAGYHSESFAFKGLSGDTVMQLWDADSLTADDLLGQTPIDASQSSGGNISVLFQRLGANYRLTYRVEAE